MKYLIFLILLFNSLISYAFEYQPTYTWITQFDPVTIASTPTASCQLFAYGGYTYVSTTNITTTSFTCTLNRTSTNTNHSYSGGRQASCPTGTLYGSSPNQYCYVADCPAPQVNNPTTGVCENNSNTCQDGQGGIVNDLTTTTNSQTICLAGCELTRINSICVQLADGSVSCLSDGKVTGQTCTSNNNEAFEQPLTPEQECLKQNLTYGTINGEVVCVPKGTDGAAPVEQTNEKESTLTNSTGTTTTNTTINHNSTTNTVTTTTTITHPDGSTETIEETKPLEDFCTTNPNHSSCKAQDDEGQTFSNPNGNNSENNNFYQTKYPDGINGIWSTAKDDIMNSSLGNALEALTPNLPDSGSAPSWQFDFNLGNNMNYGSQTLEFNLWDILLIILRISTLFYARRIIFGG